MSGQIQPTTAVLDAISMQKNLRMVKKFCNLIAQKYKLANNLKLDVI